jgi:two-component system, OmpR family, sensor histidine kinase PrrB
VAVVVAGVLVVLLARREVTTLDRRLVTLTDVLTTRITADLSDGPAVTGPDTSTADRDARELVRELASGLVVTIRDGNVRTVGPLTAPKNLPAVDGDITVGGRRYRLHTATLTDGGAVTLGLPKAATEQAVARVRRDTVLVALAAAAGATGLGWLFAGPALRPLRVLRDRTAALPGRTDAAQRAALGAGPVRSATETAELADALGGLLDRVEHARAEGEQALQAARDFAAAANHELRTPLTTLRTDLDVLAVHEGMPADQRVEVLDQLRRGTQRLEATLTALGQLAAGDLGTEGAPSQVDLVDVAAQAVSMARRRAPDLTITLHTPEEEVTVVGSEPGLRLAVDNLVLNAVRHSGGRRVQVSVELQPSASRVRLLVDDDGRGVPPEDRARLFGRFVRGSGAGAPGSGLGLALVAQQVALHGGRAELADSDLGGTRALLELPLHLIR